ncbi:MAG: 1-acyl-sn-glycerol-3-phosphate acyltransferase [Pseudomonadota bacterium]
MLETHAQVDALTEINLDDLIDSVGLMWMRKTPLRHLLRPWARRFALTAQAFDARVGEHGLSAGSAWLVARMTAGLSTTGLEHLPAEGPVFILSNHPGMTDTVALFASLASRPDLRVIALDRPFLRALPHVAQQLIFLPADESGRRAVIRDAARHLKHGGALLTFPAGEIEPDPAVSGTESAITSLQSWSASYGLLARLVPETRVVPALVSHVISPIAQRHPLTLLRGTTHDKARLAAALQVALPRYRNQLARVSFGAAQTADRADARILHASVAAQMRALILQLRPSGAIHEGIPEMAS